MRDNLYHDDPLWQIPEHAWNSITANSGNSPFASIKDFKEFWVTDHDWTEEDGWVPKRKEEDGASQDE